MAKKTDGTLFSLLSEREKGELSALRERETFYCPVCGSTVHMRLGDRRSWHFAHRNNESCPYEAEAESAYHLEGKRLLYEWLSQQGASVKLEPYLPQLKQRPDLLLHTRPRMTAIEFQCSSINPDLFTKRTKTFLHAKVIPVWLLGGNRLKRSDTHSFQLSQMDWLALRKSSSRNSGSALLYFCPESKQFAVVSHIVPYGVSKVFARISYLPMSSFSVRHLYRMESSHEFHIPEQWLKAKKQWRLHAFRSRSRAYRYVHQLYGNLFIIPPAAGWPTPHLSLIETPCYLWQSWLFHQFYLCWPVQQPVTLSRVKSVFRTLVRRGIFTVRSLPLLDGKDETLPILEYLYCLKALGFYKQTSETGFQKQNALFPPQSLDDMHRLDAVYFEKLNGIF